MNEINRVIFVSGHGVCRAPMAAELLKQQKLKKPVRILARGRLVQFPEPVNQKMEAVMAVNGMDMTGFMSQELTEEDITEHSIIFTMDASQMKQLIDSYEGCTDENTFVLSSYVGDELEIMNPYGGSLRSYGLCFEVMNNTMAKLADMLNQD